MAMKPEELNELKKLKPEEVMLLTYQLSHETNETVKVLVSENKSITARVRHLENFKLKVQTAWAAAVMVAGAVGVKVGIKTGGSH